MVKYQNLLIWWLTLSALWGAYRLFPFPEFLSEIVAKPVIWLGITLFFFWKKLIPLDTIKDFKENYTQTKPTWKVFLLPALFIFVYFFTINFRQIKIPEFSLLLVIVTLIINFSTGLVEEIIYRGILYVWLLRKTDEVTAFLFVQVLFLLAHVPTLVINSKSLSAAMVQAFFILLLGALHTLVFRFTKSIYASTLTHGVWNSLVYYLLLS